MPTSTTPIIYLSEHYPDLRLLWPAFLTVIVLIGVCDHYSVDWYYYVICIVVCFLAGATVSDQAEIDCSQRTVVVYRRLFGRRIIRLTISSLSEYEAIIYRRIEDGEGVGLRHRSGRCIWIRYFEGSRRPAEEFAWRLSCDTDIEIED